MLLPAATFDTAESVTARSLSVAFATVTVEVAVLFARFVSVVVVETLTVSGICVPRAVPTFTVVLNVTVTGVPTVTAPKLHVTTPAAWLQPVPVTELKVVFAGTDPVSTTPCASLGPRSVTVCVQVITPPVTWSTGKQLLATLMSVDVMIGVVVLAETFPGDPFGPFVVLVRVTELTTGAVTPEPTFSVIENGPLVPDGKLAAVQVIV
jgi:hypothetical protein